MHNIPSARLMATRQGQHASPGGPAARQRTGRHCRGGACADGRWRGAAGERNQPAAYPNGRALTNDVFSARVAFLANGKAGSGGLRPHAGLLAEFPFLGPPDP
jgi:hypothetical protein